MLSKIFKVVGILIAIILIGVIGLLMYVKTALPNVGPPPELKVELTPERIARGKYLANNVAACMDCHSTRDWTKFAGPLKEGTLGNGGEIFDQSMGFTGKFVSKNITPYGIGYWTDGEIFRAITTGVTKSGSAIFPVMPHPNYGKLDQEDIYSIIAYVRTLNPVKMDVEKSNPDFPMNFIINIIPQKAGLKPMPDKSDTLAYGKYLFTAYADTSYKPHTVEQGAYNSIMPWLMYAGMEKEDLAAIYTYLRTVPPIKNKVQKYTKL